MIYPFTPLQSFILCLAVQQASHSCMTWELLLDWKFGCASCRRKIFVSICTISLDSFSKADRNVVWELMTFTVASSITEYTCPLRRPNCSYFDFVVGFSNNAMHATIGNSEALQLVIIFHTSSIFLLWANSCSAILSIGYPNKQSV